MKIAVIGAGASGLPAIKSCLEQGLTPVCFERTDDIGGLWNWQEKPTDGRSTVMKSTIINTSKETSFYSDFIVPREFPNYMHNTKVLEYFRLYAERFGLTKYIKFRTDVLRVSQTDDFKETGRWRLELKDMDTGSKRVEEFDGVIVCTGHHAEKKMPHFEGQEEFEGKLIHTHDYIDYKGYEDKRVIVVGIGNSGADVTIDLSKISKQVYLSTRRGAWIVNRVSDNGIPLDIIVTRRLLYLFLTKLPENVSNYIIESRIQKNFDHSLYSIKPAHRFNQQHPTVSDDLPNRLIAGSVIVKPDIRRLNKRSVEFVDGTVVEDIDVIICATGYLFGFPFIDNKSFEVKNNIVNLYKFIFPPDISPSTIAVIGCFQPIGGFFCMSEMQCRFVARVLKGDVLLPSSEDMWKDIRRKREALSKRYVDSTRHTIQEDYIPYMDDLAKLCGCKPNMLLLFLTDPRLALTMLFGPRCPSEYRLVGPDKWSGAREAILTVMDRVRYPLKTRKTPGDDNDTNSSLPQFLAVSAIGVLLATVLLKWSVQRTKRLRSFARPC